MLIVGLLSGTADAATPGTLAPAGCLAIATAPCADTLTGLQTPQAMVSSADGHFVYASFANTVVLFRRDAVTHGLTRVACYGASPCTPTDGVPFPAFRSLLLRPDGTELYASGGGVYEFAIDQASGALTLRHCLNSGSASFPGCDQTPASGPNGEYTAFSNGAISPDGVDLYFTTVSISSSYVLGVRRADDGSLSISNHLPGASDRDIAITHDGSTVFVSGIGALRVYHHDADGTLTYQRCVGGAGSASGCASGSFDASGGSIVVSPDDRHVYIGQDEVVHAGNPITDPNPDPDVAIIDRDPVSGEFNNGRCIGDDADVARLERCTPLLPIGSMGYVDDIALSPDGKQLYVGGGGTLAWLDVDATTGDLTFASCLRADAPCPATGGPAAPALPDLHTLLPTPDGLDVLTLTRYNTPPVLGVFSRSAPPVCGPDAEPQRVPASRVAPVDVACAAPLQDPVTAQSVTTAPQHGSIGTIAGGKAPYTPTTGYVGPDTFAVDATNALGTSATSTARPLTVFSAPPSNTTPPSVTGTPKVGETLTCVPGTWVSDATFTLTERWTREGQPIPGADGLTYRVAYADADAKIACEESAASGAGTTVATSAPRTAATGPPSILAVGVGGSYRIGEPLSCDVQTADAPLVLKTTYRWRRDNLYLDGSTDRAYTPVAADARHRVYCVATVSNEVGEDTAAASGHRPASDVPKNLTPPTLTQLTFDGSPTGKQYSCDNDTWSDEDQDSVRTFTWRRDDMTIAAATAQAYHLTPEDLGHDLSCTVTITNVLGPSSPATSARMLIRLPADNGKAVVVHAGGYNRYDPSNFTATTTTAGFATNFSEQGFINASRDVCTGAASPSVLVPDPGAATCVVLKTEPTNEYFSTSVVGIFYDPTHAQPCVDASGRTSGNKQCVLLKLYAPLRSPTFPDELARAEPYRPQQYLYDFDVDGRTDLTCPAAAPVARLLLHQRAIWRIKVTVVQANSAQTGDYPTTTLAYDFHSGAASRLVTGVPTEHLASPRSYDGMTPRAALRLALTALPKAESLASSVPAAIALSIPHIAKNQPMSCRSSLVPPPEVRSTLPCVTNATIGRIAVDAGEAGGLCPVSVRELPDKDIDALPADVQDILESQALKEEQKAVGRAAAVAAARQARAVQQFVFDGSFASFQATFSALLESFNEHAFSNQPFFPVTASTALEFRKVGIDPDKAAFVMDQVYLTKKRVRINGVAVTPLKGTSVVVVPSDAGTAATTTGAKAALANMHLAASTTKQQIGVPDVKPGPAVDAAVAKARASAKAAADQSVAVAQAALDEVTRQANAAVGKVKAELDRQVEQAKMAVQKAIADGEQSVKDAAATALGGLADSFDLGKEGAPLKAKIDDAVDGAKDQALAEIQDLIDSIDLGPFAATGSVEATIGDDHNVIIRTKAQFPALFKDPQTGESPTFDAVLKGTPTGGIALQDLKISVKTANILVLTLKDGLFHYNPPTALLEAKGKIVLFGSGPAIDIKDFVLSHGELRALNIAYEGPPGIPLFPGIFLTRVGGGFRNFPDANGKVQNYVEGQVGISVGPASGKCAAAALDGSLHIDFAPEEHVAIAAGLTAICIPIFRVDADIYGSGAVRLANKFDVSLGPLFVRGLIEGSFAPALRPSDFRWQIKGDLEAGIADLPIIGSITARVRAVVSDSGIGVCGGIETFLGDISGGGGLAFPRPNVFPTSFGALADGIDVFTGCDIGRYMSGRAGARAVADGSRTYTLPAGQTKALISVEGQGGAPRAALRDASGKVVSDATHGDGEKTGHSLAVRLEKQSKTVFLVDGKPGQKYTIDPTPDSVPIFKVESAPILPAPKVTARVTGVGPRRTVTYDVAPIDGQQVRFVEQSTGNGKNLQVVKGGGKGTFTFTTSDAMGTRRKLVAEIQQDGMPRDNVTVATFNAPSPKLLAPHVRAVRRGSTVQVRFGATPLAKLYDVALTAPDGSVRVKRVLAPKHAALFSAVPKGTTRIAVTATTYLGRTSRPGRVTLRPKPIRRTKPKLKTPARKPAPSTRH